MSPLFEELNYRPAPMGALSLRRRRDLLNRGDIYEIKLGDLKQTQTSSQPACGSCTRQYVHLFLARRCSSTLSGILKWSTTSLLEAQVRSRMSSTLNPAAVVQEGG